ncbi:MAG: hypothetical protein R3E01_21845 [Pirellulaceae bacterium]|nr:hypothetical protein [Planctomycetales bacterium]
MRVTNRLVTVLFVILLATLSGCASGASALKTVVIGVPVLIVGGVLNGLGDDSEDLLGHGYGFNNAKSGQRPSKPNEVW